MRYLIILFLVVFLLQGCQSNKENEVIHKHNDFTNIERLDLFVKNIKNGKKDEIVFIQYGVEGQKGRDTLSYNGNRFAITSHTDEEFFVKYDCQDVVSEAKEEFITYTLKGCTDHPVDYELIAVPK